MDPRRAARTVIDPKVRKVGFFTPGAPPDRSLSGPPDPIASPSASSPPIPDLSPSGNSLSPVMIPPPRHSSADTALLSSSRPVPPSPLRRDSLTSAGCIHNSSELFPSSSPTAPSSYAGRVVEFHDDSRGNSVKVATGASSFPGGGFDLTAVKTSSVPASRFTTVSVRVKTMPPGLSGNCIENRTLLIKRKNYSFFFSFFFLFFFWLKMELSGIFLIYLFIFFEYIWFTLLVQLLKFVMAYSVIYMHIYVHTAILLLF
jgi:hypothetical protein